MQLHASWSCKIRSLHYSYTPARLHLYVHSLLPTQFHLLSMKTVHQYNFAVVYGLRGICMFFSTLMIEVQHCKISMIVRVEN